MFYAFQAIAITIESLDIEAGRRCEFDRLLLFDGPNPDSPKLIEDGICGNEVPVIPVSSSNKVFVVFESDSTRQYAGFRLTWTVEGEV